MKKGFISQYTLLVFVILLLLIQIHQIQLLNQARLKKFQKTQLIYIKAFQLVKQYKGESFDVLFLNEKIMLEKKEELKLSFLNYKFIVEYDKELGLLIK